MNATHPLLIRKIIQETREKSLHKPWVHCKLLLSFWTGQWQGDRLDEPQLGPLATEGERSHHRDDLRLWSGSFRTVLFRFYFHFHANKSPCLSVSSDNPTFLNIYSYHESNPPRPQQANLHHGLATDEQKVGKEVKLTPSNRKKMIQKPLDVITFNI